MKINQYSQCFLEILIENKCYPDKLSTYFLNRETGRKHQAVQKQFVFAFKRVTHHSSDIVRL